VTDRKEMEGSCSTGQSPQHAAVPVEEEEDGSDLKLAKLLDNQYSKHVS
jgi:hypothetical protein